MFAHRLAIRMRHPDVRAMLRDMPAPQFWHWAAFNRLDPFTEDRADMHAAIVAAVVANANRGRHGRTYRVRDFMPTFARQKATDPRTMIEILKAAGAAAQAAKKKT